MQNAENVVLCERGLDCFTKNTPLALVIYLELHANAISREPTIITGINQAFLRSRTGERSHDPSLQRMKDQLRMVPMDDYASRRRMNGNLHCIYCIY